MKHPFIHLRAQSSYSLAESALKIKKLVQLAKKHKMPAIALTDNNNMFGALEFSIECVENGIQPIIGSSINFLDIKDKDTVSQINFLVKNELGYKNLLYLSSLSHTSNNNPVGIYLSDLKDYTEGLICYVGGEFNPLLYLNTQNKDKEIENFIKNFQILYRDDFLFEIQRINDVKIDDFEKEFLAYSNKFNIPLICSNNSKYESAEDYNAHDALLCIAQKSTINQTNRNTSNPEIYFKTSEQMNDIFYDIPNIIENNIKVAIKCNYFPLAINPKLPKFTVSESVSESKMLKLQSNEGLKLRLKIKENSSSLKYKERLDYELEIINKMGFGA